jgi:hypothetical protein
MTLSRASHSKRAIVTLNGVILNVYNILDAWET